MQSEMYKIIKEEAISERNYAVETRRYLHMHPETGYDTQNTEIFVKHELESMGVEIFSSKMGVIGRIKGCDGSKSVLLRADMDALPIFEENDIAYRSLNPGKMHACGHDAHTAMLLGAAKILQKHRASLPVDVILMFQPAEEGPSPGGAKYMVEDMAEKGWLADIKAGFALHVFNDYSTGTVSYKYGSLAASTDEFYIRVNGKGGHAGMPQNCVDAISVSAKIVSALETFMSRRIDPFDQAICSVGRIRGGNAINVVAEVAEIAGTIRCQRNDLRNKIIENVDIIANGICRAFGADCEVKFINGLTVLMNDDRVVDYVKKISEETVGTENVSVTPHAMMGAEDFCYVSSAIPSCMLWIGSWREGLTRSNHHPHFDIDESCLTVGIEILCNFALNADMI